MMRIAPDKTTNRRLAAVSVVLIMLLPTSLSHAVKMTLVVPLLALIGFVSSYSIRKSATLLTPAVVLASIVRIPLHWEWAKETYGGYKLVDLSWLAPFLLFGFWFILAMFISVGVIIHKALNSYKIVRN